MITEQAKQRCRVLAFWERHGNMATKEAFGVSTRTLYRWQSSLTQSGGKLEGLNAKSTAPRGRRKRRIPDEVSGCIMALRATYPRLGKDKLHALLAMEGYQGSISTIGRILADLKKVGKLPDPVKLSLSAKTGRLIERKPGKRKKKLRRPTGYRVLEVDTVVRFIDGMKRYIITGVDTEKRTAFAACYTNHGSVSAADFLHKIKAVLPECPSAVQTDNGSEFALHFAKAAEESGLTHFHTNPRSPKMNAHVERFNRTLDEEFLRYHRELLRDDVRMFNEKLIDWLLWYNGERPHYALGQVAPLRSMMPLLLTKECQMWWTQVRESGNSEFVLR
ncbi:MAG: transposase [Candidatus Kerfeldbacteria bacterium]|nr:transposase [Candidatus Kerfeldbacteria bacterium]